MTAAQPSRSADADHLWRLLDDIPDPEIPVISITDLGIVRDVRVGAGGVDVTITPTYSGCPAMKLIEDQVRGAIEAATGGPVSIHTQLTPPWTTEWIGDDAKERLREFGIAPPLATPCGAAAGAPTEVSCPRCGSTDTQLTSQFGSTACKALYKCLACLEPFDYFKCI